MQKRKTIGLFLEGDDMLQEGAIVTAILEYTKEKDYNILIHHSLMKKSIFGQAELSDSVIAGEGAIYDLADFENLDGIIFLGEILRKDVVPKLVARADSFGIPCINVNDYSNGCYCVNYDDVVGMKEMVLHLIREHGCRRLCFLSGFRGNRESMEREQAYRDALEEEGIPFDPDMIRYGQFYMPVVEEVRDFLTTHEMPDAFVCANDSMAIFTIAYLETQGYRIPDDVLVTGFDSITEAMDYSPSISSVVRSLAQSGRVAVQTLEKLWAGEQVPKNQLVPASLQLNQSCGCVPAKEKDYNKVVQEKCSILTNQDIFIHYISEFWRTNTTADTIENLFRIICSYLHFFDIDEIRFVICADIFGKRQRPDDVTLYGYSQNLTLVTWKRDQEVTFENVFYPNILPPVDYDGPERIHNIYIPMFFQNRTIGYLWLSLDHCIPQQPMLNSYLTNVNSAICDFCLIKEKDVLLSQLDNMYVRDELTKLYNRFGMQRYVVDLYHRCQKNHEMMMCIAMDLDGLKKINDTYGHSAGDNAIVQIANAMRQSSVNHEICIRSGGDEFFVFGKADSQKDPAEFVRRVEDVLEGYEAMNSWPYQVQCSSGYCVHFADEISMEEMMSEADAMLYQVKERRKTRRND